MQLYGRLKLSYYDWYRAYGSVHSYIMASQPSFLYRYGSNLSTGLFLEDDDVCKIIEGKNAYWYHLKNGIKSHLGCTGDNAKTHIEALKVQYIINI